MEALLLLLEHLVTSGPARNPSELEKLLGLVEQLRQLVAPPAPPTDPPAPPAAVEQPPGGAL